MGRSRISAIATLAISITTLTPLAAHAAGATTYYVESASAYCEDQGAGTAAEPFCTLQQAAAVATTPGDTVLIGPGTYSGEIEITASGTAADPITYEPVTGTAATIPLQASKAADAYGLYLDGAAYVDLEGFQIGGSTTSAHLVDIQDSSHVTLDRFVATGSVAVTGDSGDDTISRGSISSGVAYPDAAIEIDSSGTGNVVSTNILNLSGLGTSGVVVAGSADAAVTSNTITGFCGAGIAITDDANGTASGADIENNVVQQAVTSENAEGTCPAASSTGIVVQSAADESGLVANYNDVYPDDTVNTGAYAWDDVTYQTAAALLAATGQGAADSNADPLVFGTDGLVKNESSPVINAADSNAPGELATDFLGNTRQRDPNVPETGAGTAGYDRGAVQLEQDLYVGALTAPATAPSGAAITVGAPTPVDNWANATYTYTYDFGDGTQPVTTSATSYQHTYAKTGDYTITVTAVSGFYALSASANASLSVLKPVAFSATLTPTAVYGLGVRATLAVSSDWPATTATLNFGDGSAPVSDLGQGGQQVHEYAQPGTYTLTFTYADEGGNSTTLTKSFTTAGNGFTPYGPTRLLDTRKGLGGTAGQLGDDGSIKLKVAGVGSIPADVTAVDLNLTAVDATGNGYIQANTGTKNGTSNLNYRATAVYSNSVVAQVGSDGTVTLENSGASSSVQLDLIADVTGYFAPSAADRFHFLTPARLMDTRSGAGGTKGELAGGKTDVLGVAGLGGLPATGVTAIAANVTETNTTGAGFLVAYADGAALPGSSDLNWQTATTKAASVLIPVGTDGEIDIHNGGTAGSSTDVLIDVTGYFSASATGEVYIPVAPKRVLDTRTSAPIKAAQSDTVNLANVEGMPFPTDDSEWPVVGGYVFNTTATDTAAAGWLLVSNGQSGTGTSTVNWTGAGQTVANLAIAQGEAVTNGAGDFYDVSTYNGSVSQPVDALLDVLGYFINQ